MRRLRHSKGTDTGKASLLMRAATRCTLSVFRALLLFGLSIVASSVVLAATLVPADSSWRFLKGTAEASSPDPTLWRLIGYDDSDWSVANAPFWYGDAQPSPGTRLNDMRNNYTCIFTRKMFVVTNAAEISALDVGVLSDDGCFVWINGRLALEFNMPEGFVSFDGTSLPALQEPIPWVSNTVSAASVGLVSGTNIIAVQAFNSSLGASSDFVINVSLTYSSDETPPSLSLLVPPAGAAVRQLTGIEVGFTEGVTGVDASDLLVNGHPATNCVAIAPDQYRFQFDQPAPGKIDLAWASDHGICDLSPAANRFAAQPWTYTLDPNIVISDVEISEFMASNSGRQPGSVRDELGDSPDWIEIYNRASKAVDLTGWFLTDNGANLAKWRFPPVTIPAKGYLLVLASGRNTNINGQLHTNFRIAANPGYLALVDELTNLVSTFAPFYPQQHTDVSYGRDTLDPTLTGYFTNATPGRPNSARGSGLGPEVSFSRVSGTFVDPIELRLSVSDPNWEIRLVVVTTNVPSGSTAPIDIPTSTSPLYTGPITIDTTMQVRARAFPKALGYWPGPPRTHSYVRITQAASRFKSNLPLILIHNLRGGTVPNSIDQTAIVMTFEPIDGVASLTNPPALAVRAGINIRGRSTQGLPQKSFALELWDEYNQDDDREFLGMPAESDWVLYAQNAYDPSFLHNPLVHRLARDVGRYSSRTRFAELFLNTSSGVVDYTQPAGGNYNGLYTVEEKIKRSPDRIDIARLDAGVTNLPAITGGYLLKIDSADPDERTFYDSYAQSSIVYQYPDGLEMETSARAAHKNYITKYFSDFGTALANINFTHPTLGYAPYIDAAAWIDHHLLNVLAMNADAFRLSGFFFKDRSRPIQMGPLWDFDRAMGTRTGDDARPFNPVSWMATTPLGGSDYGTDFFNPNKVFPNRWYSRLFQDPDFWQRWIDRWTELRRGPLSTDAIFARVDTLVSQITDAHDRSIQKWPSTAPRSGRISSTGYQHLFPGTFEGEIAFLKRWLSDRVTFIDTNFLAAPSLSRAGGQVTPGQAVTISSAGAKPGTTIYYTMDGTDPRLPGGGIAPGALSASDEVTLSITSNVRLVARNRNPLHANLTGTGKPPLSSPWSGAVAATYYTNPPPLIITEIMYHPPSAQGSQFDEEEHEFIELKNAGASPIALPGFRLSGAVDFTFSPTSAITSLAPSEYIVVVRNLAAFISRYPDVKNIAGQFEGNLSNDGERLALEGPLQEPILDFKYSDTWFPATDGPGFSMVLSDDDFPPATWQDRSIWRPSAATFGSPGRPDPSPSLFIAVVVNEALTHTDPPAVDAIELWNPTAVSAPIGGWFLTDDLDRPEKYRIPAGAVIPPNGYLVFDEAQLNADGKGFALNSRGDTVYLFAADETSLTGYAHGFSFGAAARDTTFGFHVDSLDREHFVAQTVPTLGQPNTGPKSGPVIISELMFDPFSGSDFNDTVREFIELRNITDQPVQLFDPLHPENTWRIQEGVEFAFPAGFVMQARGHMLVVNFDPEADPVSLAVFRSRYSVPPGVPILGPYQGNLANEGERIALCRPDQPQTIPDPFIGYVPYILVEEIAYSSEAPWPTNTAGTGLSLQRIAAGAFGNDPANWEAAAPTPGELNSGAATADLDRDGLPDEWELSHGLRSDSGTGNNGPSGDPDADDFSNLSEYVAGTDPTNTASNLAILSVHFTDGSLGFRFLAVDGRAYTLEFADCLRAECQWTTLIELPPQEITQEMEILDNNLPAVGQRYYRIVARIAP